MRVLDRPSVPRRALRGVGVRVAVAALVLGAGAPAAVADTPLDLPAGEPVVRTGVIDGAAFRVEVPAGWNGSLLLYSHHYRYPGDPNPATVVPSSTELGPRLDGETLRSMLLDRGYALAGSAYTSVGWAMEDTLRDQINLLAWFSTNVGEPTRTYAWGISPGGLASTLLAQENPHLIDGALSLCADASGVVNQMNLRLDLGYAIKTLLAPDSDLKLTDIDDPQGNFAKAAAIVRAAAEGDALAKARLVLAAAVAGVVPQVDARESTPVTEVDEAVRHLAWTVINAHGSVLFGPARAELDQRAGGNALWNTGVDYRRLYRDASPSQRRLVARAYRAAGAEIGRAHV